MDCQKLLGGRSLSYDIALADNDPLKIGRTSTKPICCQVGAVVVAPVDPAT